MRSIEAVRARSSCQARAYVDLRHRPEPMHAPAIWSRTDIELEVWEVWSLAAVAEELAAEGLPLIRVGDLCEIVDRPGLAEGITVPRLVTVLGAAGYRVLGPVQALAQASAEDCHAGAHAA
ncbi:hypothetical protein [Sinomonas halotolerans]|uniref:Uncharacterized protein n=1 Tax=Sinomonas halotolerans TaxID=1644133 RepID=A0ABU9WW15_9MICC